MLAQSSYVQPPRERAGAMACIGAFRHLCQKQSARVQPESDALFKVVLDCQRDEPFGLILAGASSMRGLVARVPEGEAGRTSDQPRAR